MLAGGTGWVELRPGDTAMGKQGRCFRCCEMDFWPGKCFKLRVRLGDVAGFLGFGCRLREGCCGMLRWIGLVCSQVLQ